MGPLFSLAMLLFTVHTASSQCTSGDLRLTGGSYTGVLQICKDNEWKNVCSTDWGNLDAAVACRQLGYDGGYTQSTTSTISGVTTDLVEYHCTGREVTLQACSSQTLTSCSRGVSLVCVHASPTDPCSSGEIRLWGGETEHEGNVELCNDHGVWSAVYENSWGTTEAVIACRQLNCTYLIAISYTRSEFGERIQPAEYGGLNCQGTESSLQQCPVSSSFVQTWSKLFFSNQRDYAGVKCICKGESVCTHGDVRVKDGFSENNGLVEICIDGAWIGVCQSSREEIPSLICRQLGFTRYTAISTQGLFQRTASGNESLAYISSLSCRSDAAVLIDCVRRSSIYGISYVASCTQLGVLCCPNDLASCSITSPPTPVCPTTVTTPTTTVTSTTETTPTTATGGDEDDNNMVEFSLYFGEAATSLIESLSKDLRGLEEDIKSRVVDGITEECNCPFGISNIKDGYFSFGVYLKYSGMVSSVESHCAADLVVLLKTSIEKNALIHFRSANLYLEVKTL